VSCIAPTSSAANKVGYKRHRAPGAFFQQLRSQPDKVGYKRHWAPGTKVLLSGEIINQKSEIINKHAGCNTVADARAIFRQLRSQPDKVGYKRHRAPGTRFCSVRKLAGTGSEGMSFDFSITNLLSYPLTKFYEPEKIINKHAACNTVAHAGATSRQLRSQPDKVGYKRHRAPGTKVLLSTKSSNQESEIINKDAGCNAVADARAHIWATPIVETL
jgi:hypothetical protein